MDEQRPIDYRLLADAIIELNICRRNVAIYPPEHPAVERALNNAYQYLEQLLQLTKELRVAFVRDSIVVGEHYLERNNPVLREFASFISSLGIVSITFSSGITRDELYRFQRMISERDVDLREMIQQEDLPHLQIEFIDYSAFVLEEKTATEDSGEGLMERYVSALLKGTLGTSEASAVVTVPPKDLARVFNKLPVEEFDEVAYERVISTYLRRAREGSGRLRNLFDLIKFLRPELKRKFLSSTIRFASKQREVMMTALQDVSIEEIEEMIELINREGFTLPETVKTLINEFTKYQDISFDHSLKGSLLDDIVLTEEMREFFGKTGYGSIVPEEYHRQIERLATLRPPVITETDDIKMMFTEEVQKEHHFSVMLQLLSSDLISEEDLRGLFNTMKGYLKEFVSRGRYRELLEVIEILKRNIQTGRLKGPSSEALEELTYAGFLKTVVSSITRAKKQDREDVLFLMKHLGKTLLPYLFNALSEEESSHVRRYLLDLIIHTGRDSIPEAISRLDDDRWYVRRNMLYIIHEVGDRDTLPYIKRFAEDPHPKVRMEALRCMLKFGDPEAVEVLRGYIESDDEKEYHQGTSLAGIYKVRDLVPELIRIVKKRGLTGIDYERKIPAIRALGKIGDIRALEAFREVLSLKSILHRGTIEVLKEEVFRHLKNFPYESIQGIVEEGLKSKNETIRRECLRLKKRGLK